MRLLSFLLLTLLLSCGSDEIRDLENPFPENAMFPNVFETEDKIYISYIHSIGDTLDELYFTTFDGSTFEEPRKVSEGKDWFVNWADVPAIAAKGDNILVSWLDKSAEGAYEYDVKMSISNDGGSSWSKPFIPHKDSINAEHGFVSLTDDFQAIWLDGRDTVNKQMTLRSAIINSDGTITSELEIDNRVCDCCQTALEKTDIGTFALYRDRSQDEIRDHFFSIFNGSSWTEPKAISDDGWKIAGCPVNGPVIDAYGNHIIAAWYTEANGKPEIYYAHYDQQIEAFSEATLISDENVMGRLDLHYFGADRFAITWMEKDKEGGAMIKANIYIDGKSVKPMVIGKTSQARGSGFPKLSSVDGRLFLIYTNNDPEVSLVAKMIELKN